MSTARLECALSDAWSPAEDGCSPEREALMRAARGAAAHYLRPNQPMLLDWTALARELRNAPPRLATTDPEGVRFYALRPRSFAEAARRWQRRAAAGMPAWVLGLRSMGSILAPVAVEGLEPVARPHRCTTLRPRGPVHERRIRAAAALRREMASWPGEFLIVDEGPGLSGSSFGGTVAFLLELGCKCERIVLLPSWELDTAAAARLSSAYAARHWMSWRRFAAAPLPSPASQGGPALAIGGGGWRTTLCQNGEQPCRAPVWGQHERLKYLADFERGCPRTLVKFAGFGGYGRQTRERAARLAGAGWGPALDCGCGNGSDGWIRYRRTPARRLGVNPGRAWGGWAGRYLAWVRSEFPLSTSPEPPSPALREMLEINLQRLFGVELKMPTPEAMIVAVDGRMPAWEWGSVNAGFIKFDGTDHGDDPFFPGPADIAWDLAGLQVEFTPAAAAAALTAYCRASGETRRHLAPRLRWHGLAYCTFRAAYCSFAAEQTAAPERQRFRRAARRYRNAVRLFGLETGQGAGGGEGQNHSRRPRAA